MRAAPLLGGCRLGRALVAVLAPVVAAARVGYGAAGVTGAITAVGAAGFLLLPLVPERVGAARARRRLA